MAACGYLGVRVSEMDEKLAAKTGAAALSGVYIGEIIPGCAAERAGLKVGDVILAINGMDVNSYSQMMEEVGHYSPGDTVTVDYLRDGKKKSTGLVLLNSKGNTDIIRTNR